MPKRSVISEDSDDELRAGSSGPCSGESPATKRRKCVEFEPIRLCSIGSVKEIDNRVLRAQHYKLCERFRLKEKIRQELEKRIEGFEQRQVQDDAVLCIINRYWNRLDEDVQLLLQRFDAESTSQMDAEMKDEEATGGSQPERQHFLNILSQWESEEMDERLRQRVEFSQRAMAKLVQTFGRISEQNGQIIELLKGAEPDGGVAELNDSSQRSEQEKRKANSENSPPETDGDRLGEEPSSTVSPTKPTVVKIDSELRVHAVTVLEENNRLQKLVTGLQAENHRLGMKLASHDDAVTKLEHQMESKATEIEDLRYRLHKSMAREEKLDFRLAEFVKKENTLQVSAASVRTGNANESPMSLTGAGEELASLSKSKLEELQEELETQTELATNRLAEVQEMTERNKSMSAELENCKMKLKYISSEDVKQSTEFRSLQTAFNSLFEDSKLQRKEIDELKQQLVQQKQTYEDQINSIKTDNLTALDRLQHTVLELDNDLNTARREYENVCVDYELNTASREQAAPINEQMNTLMNSLSTQNTQLKQEVARLKRKCTEKDIQLQNCQNELDGERRLNSDNYLIIKLEDDSGGVLNNSSEGNSLNVSMPLSDGYSPVGMNSNSNPPSPVVGNDGIKKEDMPDTTSQNGQSIGGEQQHARNATGSASSPSPPTDLEEAKRVIHRLRMERDRYREKLRQMARADMKEKRKGWSEEQKRKQKQIEEQCEKLKSSLQSSKLEEDGLMKEMDSVGQAFEDLQEQHQKLVEQLREKDDVNLKLMSERIRSMQAQKKMRDEKELVEQNIQSLENQLAAKLLQCQRLEEKERVLSENRNTLEHELRIREQNNEMLRKKAAEYSQLATDLRLRLDRLDVQFTELRESVMKKASSYEANANKIKRLEEEKSGLKRKLDRAKRMEKYENVDELLQEENRILKESLTCPSCKVNRKNAILDKCHHVFCFECIRVRYDNRRRKCPKCNAAFGANDFHRIYLE